MGNKASTQKNKNEDHNKLSKKKSLNNYQSSVDDLGKSYINPQSHCKSSKLNYWKANF